MSFRRFPESCMYVISSVARSSQKWLKSSCISLQMCGFHIESLDIPVSRADKMAWIQEDISHWMEILKIICNPASQFRKNLWLTHDCQTVTTKWKPFLFFFFFFFELLISSYMIFHTTTLNFFWFLGDRFWSKGISEEVVCLFVCLFDIKYIVFHDFTIL